MATKPKPKNGGPKKPAPKPPKPPPKANGRPKICNEDLPEGWRDMVLDEYEDGASDVEVYSTVLHISYDTFVRLLKENDGFSRTITRGRELAEAWWMKQGRAAVRTTDKDKRYNFQYYMLNMRNRYKWDTKTPSAVEDLLTEIVVDYIQPAARKKREEVAEPEQE